MNDNSVVAQVPDDVVHSLNIGDVRLGVYRDGVVSVTIRARGALPLKPGEWVEFEIVEVERSVVER